EEACALLAAGAVLVQLDEPVLSEVVFGRAAGQRSFMCGALGAKLPAEEELAFAGRLINRVVEGLPRERTALHVCRGNWTRDESVALRGDYRPLLPLLGTLDVGTFFLELCTPRAGEMEVLRELPESCRIGVGVVNQKSDALESVEEIVARAEAATRLFGAERVLLTPDCGFATFADNPVSSARVAEAKLAAVAQAARLVRRKGENCSCAADGEVWRQAPCGTIFSWSGQSSLGRSAWWSPLSRYSLPGSSRWSPSHWRLWPFAFLGPSAPSP